MMQIIKTGIELEDFAQIALEALCEIDEELGLQEENLKEVLELLNKHNIKYELVEHEEVHTMDDMEKIGLLEKGYVCKNLFLRNANGKMHFVLSCHHTKEIHLDEIAKKIGSTRLSFGSKERLEKYLMR